jgi:hypothetical protein
MKIDGKMLWTVLLALLIFAVVNKLLLEKALEKIPHFEDMLEA